MSSNQNQSQGIPGWAKAIIALGAVGGAIFVIYYAVTNVFGAGVSAYKQLYQQQWNALMQKMANYVKQDGATSSGFTAVQQASITQEENILQQTQQGLAAAANGLTTAIMLDILIPATILAIGISAALILKSKWSTKPPGSTYSYSYSVARAMADELEQAGYPTQAANMVSTAQQMFQSIDYPAMTEQIASLQTSLATLTGVELLAAQQMISLLSTDIAVIPEILVTPILV